MAEHPTPWRQGSKGTYLATAIVDANDDLVGMFSPVVRRHVIAAVNACAGESTATLERLAEHGGFKALVKVYARLAADNAERIRVRMNEG